jgi:Na+/melibiose symporter-like transporter
MTPVAAVPEALPVPAPPAPAPAPRSAWQGGWAQGLRYGALGFPLAFVALPLYVILPNHYASEFGIPLATLGALLLGARLLDAAVDPFIGRWVDGWFGRGLVRVLAFAAAAALLLALGFRGLFFPPEAVRAVPASLLLWCAVLLAMTYFSYSVVTVLHQAWGARLGGDEAQRARIVSWREGLSLLGVLVASVLPAVAGLSVATLVFSAALLVGVWALWHAPRPHATPGAMAPALGALWQPLATPAFRRLLLIYLVNGVASAVPATLVLFFIRDRLQAAAWEPLFLASYFAAGALSMPLWLRLVGRLGLARAWLLGMALAVATFAWAALLGAGDVVAYTAVCVASGVALGADLTLPGALLAGTIQRAGHDQKLEGAYFGWWNFATKLNLALAAGIALPLLAFFGYAPGARDAQALQALSIAYCLLPCALKLVSAALLWRLWLKKESSS